MWEQYSNCFRTAARRDSIPWLSRLLAMPSPSLPSSSSALISLELPLLLIFLLPPPSSLDPSFSRSHSQPGVGWKIDQPSADPFSLCSHFAVRGKMMIASMQCANLILHHWASFEGCKLEPPVKPHLDILNHQPITWHWLFNSGRLVRSSQATGSLANPNEPQRPDRWLSRLMLVAEFPVWKSSQYLWKKTLLQCSDP